eukprot:TRINITY_DN23081_c0_g1_i1.p2 TRINITY_DN23081_c0_g1~~TRINITY_DN23081_c0_g1_i1.p2  ORF type:complete len:104 (+),score=27.48 TRINITY_DN23081_c0_g1_i1:158-469(+)
MLLDPCLQLLLDEEAVGVSTSLGPEDGEDEAEEEGEQGQPHHGEDPPLPHVPLAVPGLGEHDHAAHDEPVDDHHEVSLQHKLSLRGAVDVGDSGRGRQGTTRG